MAVEEFRIALTTATYEKTLSFYRDVLGLSVLEEWPDQAGKSCLLSLPAATLEIFDEAHAAWVDTLEAGRRVSGPVRPALRFADLDARIEGPDGMQMTFFSPQTEARGQG